MEIHIIYTATVRTIRYRDKKEKRKNNRGDGILSNLRYILTYIKYQNIPKSGYTAASFDTDYRDIIFLDTTVSES